MPSLSLAAELPIPRFFEKEAGPYITAGAIVARDRVSGFTNLSIARLMPLDGNRAFVGIAPNHHLAVLARAAHARGEKLDIAVCIGNHPAVLIAACLYLGLGDDELPIAGALLGEPLEVVRCTQSDLLVPAHCECVLEGTLDAGEPFTEGPVSEFHGMYENYGVGIVATFARLTRRRDAIFQVVLPGYHPEHCLLGGVAIAAGLFRVVRNAVPSVCEVAVGLGGAGRLHAVVALRAPRAGEARKAMFAVWAAVNLIKQVIVVDDDIDPWDALQVEWATATRVEAGSGFRHRSRGARRSFRAARTRRHDHQAWYRCDAQGGRSAGLGVGPAAGGSAGAGTGNPAREPACPGTTRNDQPLHRTEKAMLKTRLTASALSANFLLSFASAIALGAATLMPAHADIKIGFQVPLTGPAATDGKSAQLAGQMAVEDINAAGGVLGQKLELVTYDDQAKSDQAIFTANKLIGEDGVKLVVNASYSASGRAAAPVFQKAGVVMISAYGVHPDITKAGDYMFRLVHLGTPARRGDGAVYRQDPGVEEGFDHHHGQRLRPGHHGRIPRSGRQIRHRGPEQIQLLAQGPPVRLHRRQRQARQPRRRLRHRLFLHRRSVGFAASRRRHYGADYRLAGVRFREIHRDRRAGRGRHLHHRQLRPRSQGRVAAEVLHRLQEPRRLRAGRALRRSPIRRSN